MERPSVIAFGEALWDLFPDGARLGGAPLNFCYRIDCLGKRAVLVSRLGADRLGEEARERILALGMNAEYLSSDEAHPTGTVHIELDGQRNPSYVIEQNVAYDFIPATSALIALSQRSDAICFGTLAQRGPESRGTLESMLDAFGGRYVLYDVNLRRDCYTEDIVRRSLGRATILKVNDEEVELLRSMLRLRSTTLRDLSVELIDRFRLSIVIVTRGSEGAFVVNDRGEEADHPGFRINLIDPCGAGDAFAAAFLVGVMEGASLPNACARGNAFGTLVAAQRGATDPISRDELDTFLMEEKA